MLHDSLKFIHVLAVIVWFGGGIMLVTMSVRARRAGAAALGALSTEVARIGAMFGAAGGIAFLSGVGMMFAPDSPWSWSALWINVGIVVFFVSSIVGARVIGPSWERMAEVAAAGDSTAVVAQHKRLLTIMYADVALLTFAVASMVFKWGS